MGRWFEVSNLRIRTVARGRTLAVVPLTLVEAAEVRDELDACVRELAAVLDVKRPPPRAPGDD